MPCCSANINYDRIAARTACYKACTTSQGWDPGQFAARCGTRGGRPGPRPHTCLSTSSRQPSCRNTSINVAVDPRGGGAARGGSMMRRWPLGALSPPHAAAAAAS